MGTRYTIKFSDSRKSRAFANVYGQYDGYLSGAGDSIKRSLTGANGKVRTLVNGYSDRYNQTNGIGCAAALVVDGLKAGECGNVYLTGPEKGVGEEFRYHLFAEDGALWMTVKGCRYVEKSGYVDYRQVWSVLYDGPLSEFDGELLEKGGDA
jgi:hypothetical protein